VRFPPTWARYMRFLLIWTLPLLTLVLIAAHTHKGWGTIGLIVAAWVCGLFAVAVDGQRPDV
jgi:hypothetical protein